MNKVSDERQSTASIDSELKALSIVLLFDKIFNRAFITGEPITRQTLEDFFGTKDFDAVLRDAAALGVDGIAGVLNMALQSVRASLRMEARTRATTKRDERRATRQRSRAEAAEETSDARRWLRAS